MKVLVIHGPNMNLLGSFSKNRLTLDKLNRSIRKLARKKEIECKIFQTHEEAKVITLLQRNRNKVDGIILNLGPWHVSSPAIKDTLAIIKMPYLIVEQSDRAREYLENTIFNKKNIIDNSDIEQSYIESINQLVH